LSVHFDYVRCLIGFRLNENNFVFFRVIPILHH